MSLGVSLLQQRQQVAAGKIQRMEANVMAEQEGLAAVSRERDRKARLADALASQNAAAGAKGIAAFEGSPLTILNEDIRREQVATERDKFMSQLSQMTTRARGVIAAKQGRSAGNIGLIRQAVSNAEKAALGGV